jgi:hypothetical protein
MHSTVLWLKRACKPGVATPVEIVHAAWLVALREGISADSLLAKMPAQSASIRAAAVQVAHEFPSHGPGIAVGIDYAKALETPSLFIPRDFLFGLAGIHQSL